jgi:signal transduction histidine kinase
VNVPDTSEGPDGIEPLVPGPPPAAPRATRRIQRVADRMPAWTGSIRFRLTAIYSLWLFGLAALVVGGIYLGLSRRLAHDSVSPEQVNVYVVNSSGQLVPVTVTAASVHDIQHLANEHTLDTLRMTSFTALSLLFLSSLVVGWVVAGRVLAPIGRITTVAREIQATDLSRRIALRGPADELRELADTFDSMLARLDEAFEGQRRFIHEASHELRNPLAVIRTNLDVTLADPDASADELRAAADVVRRSTERISRLVDDLLVYADRGSPVREHVPVDVATVVDATVAEFFVPAATNGLSLTAASDHELWVLGDRDALRRVVANLLANAVRLAPRGSEVRVAAGRADDWVWVAVDDAGPGIPADERESVFQRFWRGDAAKARAEGRSGLGLTIVRQIAEAHRGVVRLWPSERGGSTFVVWLPATSADGTAPLPAESTVELPGQAAAVPTAPQ